MTCTSRTISSKVCDIKSVKDYGATGDGVTDDTAAIQLAFNANVPLFFPQGTYKITSTLTISNANIHLYGSGDSSVLNFSTNGELKLTCTPSSLPNLSSNIQAGGNVISFSTAHGLSEGDVIVAYNPTDFSFSPQRNYYRDGCFFKVADPTNSTNIKTYSTSPDTYASASMTMTKLTGGKVHISNLKIIPPSGSSKVALTVQGHEGVIIRDILLNTGATGSGIVIQSCFDVDVKNVKATARRSASFPSSDSYPIVFNNSQKITVSNCSLYSDRHCLAMGGGSGTPVRNVIIDHCILENDGELGVGAADMHGNCDDVLYTNCIIQHANMAGRNVSYKNCKIYGRPTSTLLGSGDLGLSDDGSCIWGSEVLGGTYTIQNCELVTYGDCSSTGCVYFDVDKITEDFRLIMHNNIMENKGSSPSTHRCVMLHVGNSSAPTDKITIDIRGLNHKASSAFSILSFLGSNDVSANLSIIVDDIIAPSGTRLAVFGASANAAAPMRLQKQHYTEQLTTSTGDYKVASSTWTFRYPYPTTRLPRIVATAGSPDGSSVTPNRGGKVSSVFVNSYSATTAQIIVASGDGNNFTSAETIRIFAEASINEL